MRLIDEKPRCKYTEELQGIDLPNIETSELNGTISSNSGIHVCKRRWAILCLFSLYSMHNAYQFVHMNIISNIMIRYYNESLPDDDNVKAMYVDWLASLYMLIYPLFILPGLWLLNRYGIKMNIIFGVTLNCLASWIKCVAVQPDRFYILLIAQILNGLSNIFVTSFPPQISAVWFGADEVSFATALGVLANQLGIAIGLIVPPMLVPNSDNLDDINLGLGIMFYAGAAIATLIFLLILISIENKPELPPSYAQLAIIKGIKTVDYRHSFKILIQQPSFIFISISYGLITGVYFAIETLLNNIILYYYQNEVVNASRIGLVIILAGIVSSILAGLWLDKFKTYKRTSVALYWLSTLSMVLFTFTIDQNQIWIVFITAGILGFFGTAFLPVGYEFAAELTYPEPDGISSGVLTAMANLCGLIFTLGLRIVISDYGVLQSNIAVIVIFVIGGIVTMCIKPDYKRQTVEENRGTL
ncbi:hypothetical protein LOTGIDRAFT_155394 [Lottia gigantea]|uniref:Major facilitator superfamily (MFS) profile domain-containing protein n=1 Tax=Lottia gigantea TaxID=225164 RepID=V3ZT52_LOTGI|nr:hypothetical protein LOTGIDRAFT_155394 [Lottia gigantea]ESO84076.1 hypothetical protein LOTGIDRAFT_155394 [Lottia gigantea]